MIIPCVHKGEKTKLTIKYLGEEKVVKACPACKDIIKSTSLCEVLS